MNSINWPASIVWVFIAQLGEHCSVNAEATGSNPIEAPKTFFSGYFRNCLNCDSLRWSHTHFIVLLLNFLIPRGGRKWVSTAGIATPQIIFFFTEHHRFKVTDILHHGFLDHCITATWGFIHQNTAQKTEQHHKLQCPPHV